MRDTGTLEINGRGRLDRAFVQFSPRHLGSYKQTSQVVSGTAHCIKVPIQVSPLKWIQDPNEGGIRTRRYGVALSGQTSILPNSEYDHRVGVLIGDQ